VYLKVKGLVEGGVTIDNPINEIEPVVLSVVVTIFVSII